MPQIIPELFQYKENQNSNKERKLLICYSLLCPLCLVAVSHDWYIKVLKMPDMETNSYTHSMPEAERQENRQEFEASLGYTVSSGSA